MFDVILIEKKSWSTQFLIPYMEKKVDPGLLVVMRFTQLSGIDSNLLQYLFPFQDLEYRQISRMSLNIK